MSDLHRIGPVDVLHVAHGWPLSAIGGVGAVVAARAAGEGAAGLRSAVLCPSGRARLGGGLRVEAGAPPAVLLDRGLRPGFAEGWAQAAMGPHLDRALGALRPRRVVVHHLAGLPLGLPARARAAGAQVELILHDYHLLCPRGQLLNAAGEACPGPTPRRCGACLGLSAGPLGAVGGAARAGARLAAAQALINDCDALLSPSRDLADRLARWGLRRPRPVDLPLQRPPLPRTDGEDGVLRMIFVGSLHPSKGPDLLVRAFARLPAGAARLRLIGPDGPDRAFCEALRRAAAAAGAAVEGAAAPAAVAAALAAADLLVVPSRWAENSPLVVREASAAGLRCLVPAWGGAAELDPGARVFGAPGDPPQGPGALRDQLIEDALYQAILAEIAGTRGRPPIGWPAATAP
jgi:glycosyltransferase involved in cell wall biosynthesis